MSDRSSSTLDGVPTAAGDAARSNPIVTGALRRGDSVGRYLVLRRLGSGGMGEVYAAHDPDLDREIALKLVWGRDLEAKLSEVERKRLLREAKALARLSHPNVVVVHDAGEFDRGLFIAMEYVDGPTLRAWNADRSRSWQEIRDVFVAAGEGVAAAHDAGIVHRDFKPDNVMIDARGSVRVLDFGLARDDGQVLNTGDQWQGTPGYLAPEMHSHASADPRADVFAYCVAFYEVLFGERPFQAEGQSEVLAILSGTSVNPPVRSDVPRWLQRVLTRGLASREERWATMRELLAELQQDRVQRRRRRWALGGLALLGAAGFGFGLNSSGTDCASWAAQPAELWGPASAEAFHGRVVDAGLDVSPEVSKNTVARLDAYAQDLATAMDESCRSDEPEDSALLALRRACLEEHRDRLQVTVDALMDQPAWAVAKPAEALESLVPLSQCDAAEQRLAYRETVADPRVAELRKQILTEFVAIRYDADEGMVARVQTLIAEAQRIGSEVAEVEARGTVAVVYQERGELDEAEAQWERALSVAIGSGDPSLQWDPLNGLLFIDATAGRADEVRAMFPVARAVLDAGGDVLEPERVSLENAEGLAFMVAGELEPARDIFVALIERQGGGFASAGIFNNLGATRFLLGQYDGAEAAYRRSLLLYSEEYGPDNARTAELRVNLADVLATRGQHREAVTLYKRALLTYRRIGLEGSMAEAWARHHLGDAEFRLGRVDQAHAALYQAMGTLLVTVGPEHVYTAALVLSQVSVLLQRGETERAESLLHQHRDGLRALERSDANRLVVEVTRGSVRLAASDLDAAASHFGQALAAVGEELPRSPAALEALAATLEIELRRGDLDAAQRWIPTAQRVLAEPRGALDPGGVARVAGQVALLRLAQGRPDEALGLARDGSQRIEDNPGDPLAGGDLLAQILDDPDAALAARMGANDAGTAR